MLGSPIFGNSHKGSIEVCKASFIGSFKGSLGALYEGTVLEYWAAGQQGHGVQDLRRRAQGLGLT